MRCQNCGDFVDSFSSQQKLGPAGEGIDGEPVEADLFVCTGTCEHCGTYNQAEYSGSLENEEFLTLLDLNYEENTHSRPDRGGRNSPY